MIRVLIVEDQAILRESLARSVGDQPDMTVVAAIADASEALGVALKERPDMILMDVCTEHDSNGIVAAARIKEQLPECRVIIMTGMPEITFVDQAREAGVEILPVVLDGTTTMIGRNGMFNWRNKLTVSILPPVSAERVAAADPKELMEQVRASMCVRLAEIRKQK